MTTRSRTVIKTTLAAFCGALGATVYLSNRKVLADKIAESRLSNENIPPSSNLKTAEARKGSGISLEEAINRAEKLCHRVKEESGSPGLVVGVSIDGKTVFKIGKINV